MGAASGEPRSAATAWRRHRLVQMRTQVMNQLALAMKDGKRSPFSDLSLYVYYPRTRK
jgi:hypothetical protein